MKKEQFEKVENFVSFVKQGGYWPPDFLDQRDEVLEILTQSHLAFVRDWWGESLTSFFDAYTIECLIVRLFNHGANAERYPEFEEDCGHLLAIAERIYEFDLENDADKMIYSVNDVALHEKKDDVFLGYLS